MYKGEADWTLIGQVKQNQRMRIPIFGNGDIDSPEKALLFKERYGVDGIMIGRASIGYPWIFNEIKTFLNTGQFLEPPSFDERIEAVEAHLDFSIKWKGEKVGIAEMKRHYSNYFKGIPHVKEFRTNLVTANEMHEVTGILNALKQHVNKHLG